MRFIDILGKKRDGKELTREEIYFFIKNCCNNNLPDYQVSAFLMASYLNGLTEDETTHLTEAMLFSGKVVDLTEIPGVKVDKHSTGGVGDKPSLIIAPVCAACGVPVPMISGRGLGHTGGTLDKLEAIPGFNVNLDLEEYKKIIKETGLCLIGQTEEIAPADRKLYALRDVTCTVENKSLITASIMSKKLAEGIDALLLDVKTGSGAFMKTMKDSEELAGLLLSTGKKMGKKVIAVITDMNQPLGSCVGNALETMESIQILKGNCEPEQNDLKELCIVLASHMLVLGEKASSIDEARNLVIKSIDTMSAFNKFRELVKKQGGNVSSLDNLSLLPSARKTSFFKSPEDGYISRLDALCIGRGSVLLGAGRETVASTIEPGVGVIIKKKIGDPVSKGEPLMEIKYNREDKLLKAIELFKKAYSFSSRKVKEPLLIKKVIGGK